VIKPYQGFKDPGSLCPIRGNCQSEKKCCALYEEEAGVKARKENVLGSTSLFAWHIKTNKFP